MVTEGERLVEILLVEDSLADIRLVKEAFKYGFLSNNLNYVTDGVEALAYLKNEGKYSGASTPDLILLDLNMPRMDGREVLERLKNDDKLKKIPVIVLTTSEAEKDILMVYNLQANCYITKPVDIDKFINIVNTIETFWFKVVSLPNEIKDKVSNLEN